MQVHAALHRLEIRYSKTAYYKEESPWTDTRGSPASQYLRSLWFNRIKDYMESNEKPQAIGKNCITKLA
jgi:hypothetical protein